MMKEQKEIFKTSEGDQWFSRNPLSYASLRDKNDRVVSIIKSIELSPKKVLELGCSNGYRLNLIRNFFSADCYGIDPSLKAIEDGNKQFPGISLQVGTADNLPFDNCFFDTILFGFCLYLCDRKDLFKIAYEADRGLQNQGTIIITDFCPSFPYKNKYSHYEGIYCYKMDYARMFKWNPAYTEVFRVIYSHSGFKLRDVPDEKVATVVLRKNEQYGYLEEPFN